MSDETAMTEQELRELIHFRAHTSKHLRALLKKARLSQEDAAAFIGVTPSALSRWLNGQRTIASHSRAEKTARIQTLIRILEEELKR